MPQMIIANRLVDGVVVFLAPGDEWDPAIAAGAVIDDDAEAPTPAGCCEAARGACLVIDPQLIEVKVEDGQRAADRDPRGDPCFRAYGPHRSHRRRPARVRYRSRGGPPRGQWQPGAPGHQRIGSSSMYRYDEFDARFVDERAAQFRRQVKRRLGGRAHRGPVPAAAAHERPVPAAARVHAARQRAVRHAVVEADAQVRAHRAHVRQELRPLHDAPEHPVQLDQARGSAGHPQARSPTSRSRRSSPRATACATSRRTSTRAARRTSSPIRASTASCCASTRSCIPSSRTCRASSRSR